MDYFPEFAAQVTDARIYQVTIDHLLKMRGGFPGDQEFYFIFTSSTDWVKTILSTRLTFDPGTRMQYSTAATHLLAVILARAAGQSALDYGRQNLFNPCGIQVHDWSQDPQGNCFGGNDIIMTPRDMAVLGLLYLNQGQLNGKTILPEDWVTRSLITTAGTGTSTWGEWNKIGYGYLWWLGEVNAYPVFSAIGHGGQFVFCVPSLDLIIAVQSYPDSDWGTADIQERGVIAIIADYILPAVL
ncbi:MAG: serine hydrolase [Candidatus Delongbacteria bacterium]|nr:serine hydrolase [Candidatus Delongbacteria bacterium]